MDRGIRSIALRRLFAALGFGIAGAVSMTPLKAQEMCGGATYPFPYTDVSGVGAAFCPGIMEAYVTGISKGTTPTTFSPNDNVIRLQMTTFLQRTVDQVLTRGSRRAALNQWWVTKGANTMQMIAVGGLPISCAADGQDIWTTTEGSVVQVQANTGKVLGTWTGANSSYGVLAAAGKVFVAGSSLSGILYLIDPTQAPGTITTASSALGVFPLGIAFDGTRLWTANSGSPGSVSIITPAATTPYPPGNVTTITTGFNAPFGILYDGSNIWVTDNGAGKLLELDPADGSIVKTVSVGTSPRFPVFDGTNIWVPNSGDNSISVIQASTGSVVATISADASNLLNGPTGASFDGERVVVTNEGGNSLTLFKAADLSFIANVQIGASTAPFGACSDGVNFWLPLLGNGGVLRF